MLGCSLTWSDRRLGAEVVQVRGEPCKGKQSSRLTMPRRYPPRSAAVGKGGFEGLSPEVR